jgi:hypothetical protein
MAFRISYQFLLPEDGIKVSREAILQPEPQNSQQQVMGSRIAHGRRPRRQCGLLLPEQESIFGVAMAASSSSVLRPRILPLMASRRRRPGFSPHVPKLV